MLASWNTDACAVGRLSTSRPGTTLDMDHTAHLGTDTGAASEMVPGGRPNRDRTSDPETAIRQTKLTPF